jgi:hypothetical protein
LGSPTPQLKGGRREAKANFKVKVEVEVKDEGYG